MWLNLRINALSHSFLLLSAIIPLVPWQTPFASTPTQFPPKRNCPLLQPVQSFEDEPLQVPHDGEHTAHCCPLLKLPSGHGCVVPAVVPGIVDGRGLHFDLSFASAVKPFLQVVHVADISVHEEQPS